ncbi:receptor-type tyrosine-protein phosphatase U [Sarotherodon galilaeus]
MSSKSQPTFTTPRAVGVRKYLDRHTEPWFLGIEDRTSDGRIKSSKRKDCATERLEKASKRSKDSKSPTPGLSHLVLEKCKKKSSKRKSSSDGTKQPRSKKSKTSSSQEEASCSVYETDTPLPSTYKSHSIEDFEEKYEEQDKLGEGGLSSLENAEKTISQYGFLWTKSPAPNWQDFNATTADCVTVLQLGTVMDWLVRHIIPDDNNTSEMRTDISEGPAPLEAPHKCKWTMRSQWNFHPVSGATARVHKRDPGTDPAWAYDRARPWELGREVRQPVSRESVEMVKGPDDALSEPVEQEDRQVADAERRIET